MAHSNHGMVKDQKGQEQPTDKARAQAGQKSDPHKSTTREATRDPKLNDAEKAPGPGMAPDKQDDTPTG